MMGTTIDKTAEYNQFMQDLADRTQELYACQDAKGLVGCFDCEYVLDCKTRTAYVDSVYLSMNQGENKDFNF